VLFTSADAIALLTCKAPLDAIADQGKGREAEKRRRVCTAMFRWALSQDIVEADPTAGLEAYDRGTPRDRVLTVEEIESLWRWLESDAPSLEAADILKLELLIGARCGELSGLRAERSIGRNGSGRFLLRARRMAVSVSRRSSALLARSLSSGFLASRRGRCSGFRGARS